MNFTEDELEIIRACVEFVKDGNVGFEAIEDWTDLDEEEFEEALQSLKNKLF